MKPAILFGVLLSAVCLLPFGHSQTTNTGPEKALKKSLLGQALVIANFSAANKIKGTWDGKKPTLELAPWHALAALHVNKVKLDGKEVTIEGLRRQIVRDASGKLIMGEYGTSTTLTITLVGDSTVLAPTLRDAIFFRDFDAAVDRMPKEFQSSISQDAQRKKKVHDPAPSNCDCRDLGDPCEPLGAIGLKPPKVLSSADPQFSNEARVNHISGNVLVGVRIDAGGGIKDEWILQDAGYGLDPQAAFAVRKYKFAPATCHDNPTEVDIEVQVKFRIS